MKALPVLMLKRGSYFPNGCCVCYMTKEIFEVIKIDLEYTDLTFSKKPMAVIVVQPEILELLTDEEAHALFMHEQGHIESGHGQIQTEVSLSHAQEIQADDWAINEAGVNPAVLKTTLLKVIGMMCNHDVGFMETVTELLAPRLQYLS